MSGQKQKRPYKRREASNADEPKETWPNDASIEELKQAGERLTAFGHDKAEQIGHVTSVDVIGQDDQGFAVTMSATPNPFGMSEMPKDGFIISGTKGKTEIEKGLLITPETVSRVEAAVGRTSNAWGMVDPLGLIRAVDRVLRG